MRSLMGLALSFWLISGASAQTGGAAAVGAIQAFHLLGTWSSIDCRQDIVANRPGIRVIFATASSSRATRTMISSDGHSRTTVHTEILDANWNGGDTITLRMRITGGDRDGGPLPDTTTGAFDQAIQKAGTWSISLKDREAILLNRCN